MNTSTLPVRPTDRTPAWAQYGEPVVFIDVQPRTVTIRTGRINSWPGCHPGIDNVKKVLIRFDVDAHAARLNGVRIKEDRCNVADPHLLKNEEARLLLDPEMVFEWFRGTHHPRVIAAIHEALGKVTFSYMGPYRPVPIKNAGVA